MATQVTADLVRAAYVLFFGREPESESVVRHWQALPSSDALRKLFLASPEFRTRNGMVPAAQVQATPPSLPLDVPPLPIEWEVTSSVATALLATLIRTWARLGAERPHWSSLAAEAFKPEQIAANETAFFASGARDVQALIATLHRNGFATSNFARVFEFGCGAGRVTPHLARAFQDVAACDISEGHMAVARAAVAKAEAGTVSFGLATDAEFGMAAPFDLWFSRIVLQHNPPPLIARILERALALLAPGGVAVFQVPTYALGYQFRVDAYLSRTDDGRPEMHVLPQPVVFEIARTAGCRTLEVWDDKAAGQANWLSNTFVLHKATV